MRMRIGLIWENLGPQSRKEPLPIDRLSELDPKVVRLSNFPNTFYFLVDLFIIIF